MRNYLFYRCLVFSALLVSSLTFATPRIIIKDATLIDADNPIRENMTVVLHGDVIQFTSRTPTRATWVSKEADMFKEFEFVGFLLYFSFKSE